MTHNDYIARKNATRYTKKSRYSSDNYFYDSVVAKELQATTLRQSIPCIRFTTMELHV